MKINIQNWRPYQVSDIFDVVDKNYYPRIVVSIQGLVSFYTQNSSHKKTPSKCSINSVFGAVEKYPLLLGYIIQFGKYIYS